MFVRPSFLIAGYLILTLLPLALAYGQDKPARSVADEVASGLGMTAFAILLMEFVLSGRFRTISRRAGMDVTMRFHQLLARTAVAFIVLHPFLYQTPLRAHGLPWDMTGQMSLGLSATTLTTGGLALILLVPFVLMAIYRDQIGKSYETWRLTHGVGAILIAGLSAHHAIGAGRYSADPLLAGFWLVLLAIATLTLILVYVVRPLMHTQSPWRVASVAPIADRIWELVLEPDGDYRFRFEAGQFAWINVGHSPFSLSENPFSIASAPSDEQRLGFVIKELGDFTSSLGQIEPGTPAYVDGPYGHMTGRAQAAGLVLIAGGVGIAPMLSILRHMRAQKDARPVVLFYGNRFAEQIIYRDELDVMAEMLDLSIHMVLSEPDQGWTGEVGFVDSALFERVFRDIDSRDWFHLICGPPAMIEKIEGDLLSRGVPASRIVSERFRYD